MPGMSCCSAVMSLPLQMYLVLGVVSLYQSNFEPIAQFDHRQLLPTPTAGGAAKGGSNKRSGSDRKKSGERTEVSLSRNCAQSGLPNPGRGSRGCETLLCPMQCGNKGSAEGKRKGRGGDQVNGQSFPAFHSTAPSG